MVTAKYTERPIIFTNESIQFEEWNIPYHKIQKAIIFKPTEAIIPLTTTFRVYSDSKAYEFTTFRLKLPNLQFPFPVQNETVSILTKKQIRLIYLFVTALILIITIFNFIRK